MDLSKYVFDPEEPGKTRVYKLLKKVIEDRNNVVLFDREAFAYLFGKYLWDEKTVSSIYTMSRDEFLGLSEIKKVDEYLKNYSRSSFFDLFGDHMFKIQNDSLIRLFANYARLEKNDNYSTILFLDSAVTPSFIRSIFDDLDYSNLIPSFEIEGMSIILFTLGEDFHQSSFDDSLFDATNVFIYLSENGNPLPVSQSPSTKPIILKKVDHINQLVNMLVRESGDKIISKENLDKGRVGASGFINNLLIQDFFSIHSLNIKDIGTKNEIYIIGENGDGKTLFLQGLALAVQGNRISTVSDKSKTGHILALLDNNKNTHNVQAFFSDGTHFHKEENIYHKDIYAYGVNRNRANAEEKVPYGFETLFFDPDRVQYLESPVEWLKYLHAKALEKETGKGNGQPAIPLEDAINILKDIIDDDGQKQLEVQVSADGVVFSERGSGNLRFDQLSEGYRTVMIWLVDLVSRLSKSQPEAKSTKDFTGIVIVDELGLHLHPKWEYELPKKLRKLFPKIQFFFSTHSPILIQGASEDAVFYRLYKEDGETKISEPYYQKDLNNLMLNGILTSPLFDLDTARMRNAPEEYTSDEYLIDRIRKQISDQMKMMKQEGKVYFSQEEIDTMVAESLNDFPEE